MDDVFVSVVVKIFHSFGDLFDVMNEDRRDETDLSIVQQLIQGTTVRVFHDEKNVSIEHRRRNAVELDDVRMFQIGEETRLAKQIVDQRLRLGVVVEFTMDRRRVERRERLRRFYRHVHVTEFAVVHVSERRNFLRSLGQRSVARLTRTLPNRLDAEWTNLFPESFEEPAENSSRNSKGKRRRIRYQPVGRSTNLQNLRFAHRWTKLAVGCRV